MISTSGQGCYKAQCIAIIKPPVQRLFFVVQAIEAHIIYYPRYTHGLKQVSNGSLFWHEDKTIIIQKASFSKGSRIYSNLYHKTTLFHVKKSWKVKALDGLPKGLSSFLIPTEMLPVPLHHILYGNRPTL